MLKTTNLAAGKQPVHFTVAALPLPPKGVDFPLNALKAFADAAGLHVSGTAFSWDAWDTTKSTITAHYEFPVTEQAGGLPTRNPSVITTLFKPHQALLGEADGSVAYVLGEDNKPYSYNSPRGPLKLVRLPVDTNSKTARYSITYPYYGYVPALPDLSLSSEELSALKGYLSADSRQTPAATTDFLNNQQPDAYSAGTKIYYKLMQTIFWLQQLQQVDGIPNFRGSGQFVDKQEAIKTLVSFLKTDLETFFSATRPPELAYQWHFINPDANDVGKFTQTIAEPKLPQIFPCKENDKDDTTCNPLGDPLLKEQGTCWKLTQQDLIDAQATGKNPYLVLRGLDFTVNEFARTGPAIDTLLHFAWKQARTDLKMADIVMYVFYALASKKADPGKPEDWTQCVWINEEGQGKIKLKAHSNTGIGNPIFNDEETPWHVRSVTYNGTSTYAPEQRMQADKYDVMLVFDCGADCENFPLLCAGGTNPPNVSDPSWDGWEITLGPVHFGGKFYKFIAYNSVWNSLLGNVTWYGSIENLSDHHFGWGYLIKAAALIAQFDTDKSWWDIEHGWGGIVNLMIRDVMDWRKPGKTESNELPFVRCKYLNPVEGHMYANGHGNTGDGNDEESSSEAVNFANACIEWGAVTGQNDIRDMGILLHSMYAQAVPMYWFNVDGDVLPSTTANEPFPVAAQITGAGNKHDTYFSGGDSDAGCPSRNSDVVAIETLPVTAGTLRLTLFTHQLQVAWETVTNAGGAYCAPNKCYLSTLLSFQALFDAASAKAAFLKGATPNPQGSFNEWYNYNPTTHGLKQPEDHSYATTYAFILSLERLGAAKAECVSSPDSNPFYMPMADGSLLIYNPTSTEREFRIRNVSVKVPPLRCLHVNAAGVPIDSTGSPRT